MTWVYHQSTGELWKDGRYVSRGYSGKGRGKNNPSLQGVQGVGPIPKGRWKILAPYNSANVGPYAIPLEAMDSKYGDDKHQETGRSAFRIHGDSIKAPGTASRGCIILPRVIRERIGKSTDKILEVVE